MIAKIIQQLQPFTKILVTGPQRSGTTFCSKTIAKELNLRHVDESLFIWEYPLSLKTNNIDKYKKFLYNSVKFYLKYNDRFVMQLPSSSSFCHQLIDEVAIIFMIRNIEEIIDSQKRINWQKASIELGMYNLEDDCFSELEKSFLLEPSVVKYTYWEEQKENIKYWFEIKYNDLSDHKDWVKKELRKNFTPKQTRIK